MITGCLQQKNNTYYAVLYIKVDGKRKTKWIPTGLPVAGTSDRKAKKAFDQIRLDYEQEQEAKERREAEERVRELIEGKRMLKPFHIQIDIQTNAKLVGSNERIFVLRHVLEFFLAVITKQCT